MATQLNLFDAPPPRAAPVEPSPEALAAQGLPPTPWADNEMSIYAEERRLGVTLPRPSCPLEYFWPKREH